MLQGDKFWEKGEDQSSQWCGWRVDEWKAGLEEFKMLSPEHPPGTPHPLQVAVIAGNFELGELIRNHREQDVGE